MEHVSAFKATSTAILAALTALWGWFGWLVLLWVGLMLLDYITGSVAAGKDGTWSSKVARDGIFHKLGCIVAVMVAGGADLLIRTVLENIPGISLPFDYTVLLCPLVLVWYILTELGSIIENAAAMGAPVPGFLKTALQKSKDAVDEWDERVP